MIELTRFSGVGALDLHRLVMAMLARIVPQLEERRLKLVLDLIRTPHRQSKPRTARSACGFLCPAAQMKETGAEAHLDPNGLLYRRQRRGWTRHGPGLGSEDGLGREEDARDDERAADMRDEEGEAHSISRDGGWRGVRRGAGQRASSPSQPWLHSALLRPSRKCVSRDKPFRHQQMTSAACNRQASSLSLSGSPLAYSPARQPLPPPNLARSRPIRQPASGSTSDHPLTLPGTKSVYVARREQKSE